MTSEAVRQDEPTGAEEVDGQRGGMADALRRFSVGASAKFAFRTACYLAGRTADKLVSVYTQAVTLDRDYLAGLNKSTGLDHARHKRWGKAIPLLEKSLAADPEDGETRMRLASGSHLTTPCRDCGNT